MNDSMQRFRISILQQRLWPRQLESAEVRVQALLEFQGEVDPDAVRRALEEVVGRHGALRTAFPRPHGLKLPVQEIRPEPAVDWQRMGVSGEREAEEVFVSERLSPFVLEEGPLVRARWMEAGGGRAYLLLGMPAVCTDGRGLRTLVEEVLATWGGRTGEGSVAGEEPVQYVQFSEWHHEMVEAGEVGEWRGPAPSPLVLPGEALRDRPPVVDRRVRRVGAETGAALEACAADLGVSSRALVLAAWQILLARLGDEPEPVLEVELDGRSYEELQEVVGLFARPVPVPIRISPDRSFADTARRAERALALAIENQEEAPESPGDAVGFAWVELPAPAASAGGNFRFHDVWELVSPARLRLVVVRSGTELDLQMQYRCDRFSEAVVDRLVDRLATLLGAALAEPERSAADLDLLGAEERRRLLVDFNDTAAPAPGHPNVHALFAAQAAGDPEAVALTWDGGSWTYGELARRSSRLAARLRGAGVGPERVVALALERSPALVVAVLATLEAGGAYLPLDPAQPRERLAAMLVDGVTSVILARDRLPTLPVLPDGVEVLVLGAEGEAPEGPTRATGPAASPENRAYLLYTSGSTGRPKGVEVSHRAVLNYLAWAATGYPADGEVPLHTPLTFDLTVTSLLAPLASGGRVRLIPEDGGGEGLVSWLEGRPEVGLVKLTPSHLALLLRRLGDEISGVDTWVVGGEELSPSLVRSLFQRAPRSRVINEYGPTEATVGCSLFEVPRESLGDGGSGEGDADGDLPIGTPIRNVRLYVVDRRMHPVPAGVAGELLIGGDGLARCYAGAPVATAAAFVPDPFSGQPGQRLYRSGDRCWMDAEGRLRFAGRADDQIKLRGYRIEPGEIEAALLRHPRVAEAAVRLWRDSDGDGRLAAYVVPDGTLEPEELRPFLASRLPEPMLPATFTFLDRIPVTRHGKVDRAALPEPEAGAGAFRGEWEEPRSDTERHLAALWSNLLRVPAVGRNDDFFALGGHSLLATELAYHVLQSFGVEVDLSAFFADPTLAPLAARVDATAGSAASMPRRRPGAAVPLSSQQHRLWFLDRLQPGAATYHVPAAIRLLGPLDRTALEAAFADLVERHEALRTRFPEADGEPVQEVLPPAPVPLQTFDLEDLEDEARDRRLRELASREATRPFDLARGPLLRLGLVRLGEDDHVLLITLHHIVSDGWSVGILVREVVALYRSRSEGIDADLPELPVQYGDYALWQRQRLEGDETAEGLAYWRHRLFGAPPVLPLPTDRPRNAMQTYRGAVSTRRLDGELADRLRHLGRRHRATPFVTLLAGFFALLQRWTASDDLVVGTDVANRSRPETRGLIGFLINQLPLRLDLSDTPPFTEVLERTRRTVQEAMVRQDLPFDQLVEAVQPDRDLAVPPVFQVAFTYEEVPELPSRVGALTVEPLELPAAAAKLDLEVNVQEADGVWTVHAVYNADLFAGPTLDRLLARYERLLGAVVERPALRPTDLPLLDDAERHQVLDELGRGRRAEIGEVPLSGLLWQRAREAPDAVVAVCGNRHLTWSGLERISAELAAGMVERGVGPGDLVALLAERGLELVLAQLATWRTGAAWLPLDPRYPAARHRQVLERAAPRLLVVSGDLRAVAEEAVAELPGATAVVDLDGLPATAGPEAAADLPDLAYVIFTSGSTGTPKGAGVTHVGMLNHLQAKIEDLALGSADVVAQTAPQSFDIYVWQVFAPLMAGGRLEILEDGVANDPERLMAAVEERRVSVLQSVPSLLRVAFDEGRALEPDGPDLSALRWLSATGEALAPELARRWLAARPGIPLLNAYGPTECSDDVTHHVLRSPADAGPGAVPIGRPLPNLHLYVVDPWGHPAPVGVPGELCVGGIAVGRGYVADPRRTADAFRPDLFRDEAGGRLYRTGDLCRLDATGTVHFLGRIDHQVKVRGFRIELGEVETVLGSHPGVREAVAAVHRDDAGDDRLVAYLVAAGEEPPGPAELAGFVGDRLPDHMVPVSYTVLESLPLTANGKIDRKALPAPDLGAAARPSYQVPATDTESTLAGLWEELLGVDRVGRRDDLFELGGHSLTATRLAARIRNSFGIDLPLRELFVHTSLSAMAERIDEEIVGSADPTELAALLESIEAGKVEEETRG